MGIVTSEGFGFILDPGLRKIFMDEYALPEGQKDNLFGIESSSKAVEYDLGIGGTGDMQEFDGTIVYGDFKQQYRTSYSHKEWVKGMKIERKLVDDDQYSVINKRPAQLALVAKRTQEKQAASVFNNAFTTAIFTGGDGLSLCNSAHTWVGTASTSSNTGTTALSATAVEATRLAMRLFTDETGNLMIARGDTLVVPPALEEAAWEIVNASGKMDTADNNPNFNKGKYKIVVWDYLSDTNNWFMINSKLMKEYLSFYEWNPVEFFYAGEFDTLTSKHAGYCSVNVSAVDWRFVFGHAVS